MTTTFPSIDPDALDAVTGGMHPAPDGGEPSAGSATGGAVCVLPKGLEVIPPSPPAPGRGRTYAI